MLEKVAATNFSEKNNKKQKAEKTEIHKKFIKQ